MRRNDPRQCCVAGCLKTRQGRYQVDYDGNRGGACSSHAREYIRFMRDNRPDYDPPEWECLVCKSEGEIGLAQHSGPRNVCTRHIAAALVNATARKVCRRHGDTLEDLFSLLKGRQYPELLLKKANKSMLLNQLDDFLKSEAEDGTRHEQGASYHESGKRGYSCIRGSARLHEDNVANKKRSLERDDTKVAVNTHLTDGRIGREMVEREEDIEAIADMERRRQYV